MASIVSTQRGIYILVDPGPASLASQQDLLDLMGSHGSAGGGRLLIPENALHPDFFDLSSGLAGEIALKLSTYRVKTAIVVEVDDIPSQRFREWAWECNRGKEIHFCSTLEDAETWLLD